ncbi:Pantoate--beta-alanine ligase [uncultured Candidatus Thioglobus sp.]|nr:Pantoate--beta-alanine ligase [uncultured Candidatus Thioglobus sp.]
MQVFNTITNLQSALDDWRSKDQSIAFVPTMGGLHDGHLSLVSLAKTQADIVVVSVFVNPAQFGQGEDFSTYPRTQGEDLQMLRVSKVDVVFTPDVAQIYPKPLQNPPDIGVIGQILCGKTRPHFFAGVAQVVRRLFEIVEPDVAIFGQKDYQQLLVIKQTVKALALPIEILSGNIVRENDGLAMSTRNQYLSPKERIEAANLYKVLQKLKQEILSNGFDTNPLLESEKALKKHFKIDYLSILDANTLSATTDNTAKIAILCAVFLGSTRLIDNIIFTKG